MKTKARIMAATAQTTKCSSIWEFTEGRHATARSNAVMGTHRMIFPIIGNLISRLFRPLLSRSVN
jgi:hypothetical protein